VLLNFEIVHSFGVSFMPLLDCFDRLYIIHLPERVDRYQALSSELASIGIDIQSPKIRFPEPLYPQHSHGFPSIGVYCNFMRHLAILKESLQDGLERVWILEDDAIFRHQLRREDKQEELVVRMQQDDWDICYLGHSLKPQDLDSYPSGLVRYRGDFLLAHCYCVHARILPQLVQYFEETLLNSAGHYRGGRLYIDGAFNMFRRFYPGVVCRVSNPNLSNQGGSSSSLAAGKWYTRAPMMQPLVTVSRQLRDEAWRLNILA